MNFAEHFFCSSSFWRSINDQKLLPWLLSNATLGDHLLEIGSGYGAATPHLQARVPRVTSLEYNLNNLRKLRDHAKGQISAVCGDASRLPFASNSFSFATAILVLHHLKSAQAQDAALSELFRVLRPGAMLVGFEITPSWLQNIIHIGSSYTPLVPSTLNPRLVSAGFANISIDTHTAAFRFSAQRPAAQM
jgi:ubiquinone/menaquinone biosynthesis C-methylase UbiE